MIRIALSTFTRKTCLVEFQQSFEVNEDSLGGFGSQVSFEKSGRTNVSFEHQVELDWFRQVVAGDGRLHLELFKDSGHFVLVHSTSKRASSFKYDNVKQLSIKKIIIHKITA
jgi:hypothetical protein